MSFPVLDKANNQTRYDTDDLNALFQFIVNRLESGPVHFPQVWSAPQMQFASLRYTYLFGLRGRKRQSYGERRSLSLAHFDAGAVRVVGPRPLSVKLPSPRALLDKVEPVVAFATISPDGVLTAPSKLTEDIFGTVLSYGLNNATSGLESEKLVQIVRETRRQAIASYPIRIHDKVESGAKAKKPPLSKEQRLNRLLSPSFYGAGGVLKGPRGRFGWSSGARSSERRWTNAIASAAHYYERELGARQKHAPAIEKLGGTAPPYETFADLLRRAAEDYDEKA